MDKNEILEKSRKENKVADERELQIKCKASSVAQSVGVALCFIWVLVEAILTETSVVGMACLSVFFIMLTVKDSICFFSLKNNNYLVSAIFDLCFFVVTIVCCYRGMIPV